jgi:hypothetical protein
MLKYHNTTTPYYQNPKNAKREKNSQKLLYYSKKYFYLCVPIDFKGKLLKKSLNKIK